MSIAGRDVAVAVLGQRQTAFALQSGGEVDGHEPLAARVVGKAGPRSSLRTGVCKRARRGENAQVPCALLSAADAADDGDAEKSDQPRQRTTGCPWIADVSRAHIRLLIDKAEKRRSNWHRESWGGAGRDDGRD